MKARSYCGGCGEHDASGARCMVCDGRGVVAPEYTCASCNQFTDCQSAFGAPGEVGLGCADWQPAPTLTNGGRHEGNQ